MNDFEKLAAYSGLLPYETAREQAQARANADGRDFGLETVSFGYPNLKAKKQAAPVNRFRIFALPAAEFRYGFELRCEVVHPERGTYQPGHGPDTHPANGWA